MLWCSTIIFLIISSYDKKLFPFQHGLQLREEPKVTQCQVKRVGSQSKKWCVVFDKGSWITSLLLKSKQLYFVCQHSACANTLLKMECTNPVLVLTFFDSYKTVFHDYCPTLSTGPLFRLVDGLLGSASLTIEVWPSLK